jgi:hypothetical protein
LVTGHVEKQNERETPRKRGFSHPESGLAKAPDEAAFWDDRKVRCFGLATYLAAQFSSS